MKVKDIEDCSNCPLSNTEYCAGGMTSNPGGTPIEPPCCSWGPEDEIEVEDYESKAIARDKYYDRIYEEKKKLEEKRKLKNKRAREARIYVYIETKEIKKLRKRIEANCRLISLANAVSTVNGMMRIEDSRPSSTKSLLELENKELQNKIKQLKKIKKEKLKELRGKRKNGSN
jgi:hypothetical protein